MNAHESQLNQDAPRARHGFEGCEAEIRNGVTLSNGSGTVKPVERIMSLLNVKNGMAYCPAHEDKNRSLSITEADDGRALIKCHAGCRTEDIVKALGLSMSDLFPSPKNTKKTETGRRVHGQPGYKDYRKTIISFSDNTKTAFFERCENGTWIKGLNGKKQTLYSLNALNEPGIKFLSESEKDADQVNLLGLPCLAWGGAENWKPYYADDLAGQEVIILAHNDKPGAKAAEKVARDLAEKGCSVRIIPGETWGAHKGADIADWIQAGHTKEDLAQIIAQAEPWKDEGPAQSGYKALTISSFLSINLPERELIIDPVLPEQGLAMLYGPRGVAKTWVVLQMAYRIASSGIVLNHWKAGKPRRVLYIDGEMPARTMQERLASIVAGSDKEPPDPSYLSIITPDLQDMAMPNLAQQEGQDALEPLIQDTDVVIVDNLACLARHGRENDSESWLPVQTWLLSLRRQGKSVITVHHAGKGGAQRGTSSREDVLDTVISLRRPKDYDPSEGARFEVHLEKARGVYGPEAAPFEVALRTERGAAIWTCRTLEDSVKAQVLALKAEEYSIRDIATETGLSRSKVQRILKGAES